VSGGRLAKRVLARTPSWLALAVAVFTALVAFPGIAYNPRQRIEPPVKATADNANRARYDIHQGKTTLPATDTLHGFTTRLYIGPSGAAMTFYLYTPPAAKANPSTRLPITVVLMGSGERAEASATLASNRARALNDPYINLWTSAAVQNQWPGYVLVPQVAAPARWVDVPGATGSYQLAAQPSSALALVKGILDLTIQEAGATLDPRRVYITGISMGAYGVWDAIERWPETFAAAAPVAGAGDPARASALVSLPIWDFHGSGDETVPITGSTDMIQAIQAAGGQPKFTLISSTTHDIWVKAYTYPGFLQCLYAQRAGR
jgi:predicted peptidase